VAINSSERKYIIDQIATIDSQITALNAAYTASLTNSEVESYTLDTGQGRQSVRRRDPDKIFSQIRNLEIRRTNLIQKLNGSGVVNLRLNNRDGR